MEITVAKHYSGIPVVPRGMASSRHTLPPHTSTGWAGLRSKVQSLKIQLAHGLSHVFLLLRWFLQPLGSTCCDGCSESQPSPDHPSIASITWRGFCHQLRIKPSHSTGANSQFQKKTQTNKNKTKEQPNISQTNN